MSEPKRKSPFVSFWISEADAAVFSKLEAAKKKALADADTE